MIEILGELLIELAKFCGTLLLIALVFVSSAALLGVFAAILTLIYRGMVS